MKITTKPTSLHLFTFHYLVWGDPQNPRCYCAISVLSVSRSLGGGGPKNLEKLHSKILPFPLCVLILFLWFLFILGGCGFFFVCVCFFGGGVCVWIGRFRVPNLTFLAFLCLVAVEGLDSLG